MSHASYRIINATNLRPAPRSQRYGTPRLLQQERIIKTIARSLSALNAKSTIVAFATTCRALERPFLDILWESQDDWFQLLKCFPPDVWEERDNSFHFLRNPIPAEWARFRRYASRMIRMNIMLSQKSISIPSFQILNMEANNSPLFPKLRTLSWRTGWDFVPFISSFLSPSLSSVTIYFVDDNFNVLRVPALYNLANECHRLEEIHLFGLTLDRGVDNAMSDLLLKSANTIRVLKLYPGIQGRATYVAMQLPNLRELGTEFTALPSTLPSSVFPALQSLNLWVREGTPWVQLLPCLRGPSLEKIAVYCADKTLDAVPTMLGRSLPGVHLHRTLTSLEFVGQGIRWNLTHETILPFFSFRNLTRLSLLGHCQAGDCHFSLTDRDITGLSFAMPNLTFLGLGSHPCNNGTAQVTFASLVILSMNCRSLEQLRLHFDATSIVKQTLAKSKNTLPRSGEATLFTSTSRCRLNTLHVGNIPFPDVPHSRWIVATALLHIFPHLIQIKHSGGPVWKDVLDCITICRMIPTVIPGPDPTPPSYNEVDSARIKAFNQSRSLAT